jgi:hypothetical protein
MKCPLCQSEMKSHPNVAGLCPARNVEKSNVPALEPKINLLEALQLDVDICSNPNCRHVALAAHVR